MNISFHGAARTVTGSKHLLDIASDTRILLDCGLFQGMGKDTVALNEHWGFDPATLSHVIISHAHIDHIGLLPRLVRDGYQGKIFCTPATAALAKILLVDSARIQESDISYVNKQRSKQGRELVHPLYSLEDAEAVFPLFETIPYGEHYKIDKGITLYYTDCGHILGSAAINLEIVRDGISRSLCFSGDVGRYHDMILRAPDTFPQADYIILESTYGDRLHDLLTVATEQLLEQITDTCLHRHGKLIIPAFSLGRTQEILYLLNRLEIENRLPKLTYYVDSPLSVKITETIKHYPDYFNAQVKNLLKKDEDVFSFSGLTYIEDVRQSIALNDSDTPCVIISASGMAEAGRVKHHIANNVGSTANTILLTGYCEPRSLGGRLKQQPSEVHIFGKTFPVLATIAEIRSLSAHGDYEDLCQWLSCQDPRLVKKIFLVHGEYAVQQNFRERLLHEGFSNIEIPDLHQQYSLED